MQAAQNKCSDENVMKQTSYVTFTAVSLTPGTVTNAQQSFIIYLLNKLNSNLPSREKMVGSGHREANPSVLLETWVWL